MKPFVKGDAVKVTARYAAILNSTPRSKVNWTTRRGVVRCANAYSISIVWDGVRNPEPLPVKAVELA